MTQSVFHFLLAEIQMHEGAAQRTKGVRKPCHFKIFRNTMTQERLTCVSQYTNIFIALMPSSMKLT